MEVEIEGMAKLTARFDSMVEKLNNFGKHAMPDELTNWQSEDMKRHFPNTETPDDKTAATEIFPRSRIPSQHKRPSAAARLVPLARPKGGSKPPPSTRPILREELWNKLCERMDALLGNKLTW
jgi:hypothetical protein